MYHGKRFRGRGFSGTTPVLQRSVSFGVRLELAVGYFSPRPPSQVELGETAETNKLGIYTDDSAKQESGVSEREQNIRGVRACVRAPPPLLFVAQGAPAGWLARDTCAC